MLQHSRPPLATRLSDLSSGSNGDDGARSVPEGDTPSAQVRRVGGRGGSADHTLDQLATDLGRSGMIAPETVADLSVVGPPDRCGCWTDQLVADEWSAVDWFQRPNPSPDPGTR